MRNNPFIKQRVSELENRKSDIRENIQHKSEIQNVFASREQNTKYISSTLKRIVSKSNLKERVNRNHANALQM